MVSSSMLGLGTGGFLPDSGVGKGEGILIVAMAYPVGFAHLQMGARWEDGVDEDRLLAAEFDLAGVHIILP